MISQEPEDLREAQLAFMGKLLAGVSHEFKNHLAVIKELSGLMEDLLNAEGGSGGGNHDRFLQIVATQAERAGLAAEKVGFLNRFAHRLDRPCSSLSVYDLLEEEAVLLAWLGRQKDIELQVVGGRDLPAVFNNPSLLQFLFFSAVKCCFDALETSSRIRVSLGRDKDAARIEVECEGIWGAAAGGGEKGVLENAAFRQALELTGAEFIQESASVRQRKMIFRVSSLSG